MWLPIFAETLDCEAFERLAAARPPDNVSTLLDLIRQAQSGSRATTNTPRPSESAGGESPSAATPSLKHGSSIARPA
jgi:hypothetical protein